MYYHDRVKEALCILRLQSVFLLSLFRQVERLLGTVDAAVYLLDYTKLKTEDESTMFERLKEVRVCLLFLLCLRCI
jgi:hypothetical protein